MYSVLFTITGLATLSSAAIQSITGHTDWRSTIGVPGCQVSTDDVSYFPSTGTCDSLCVKVKNTATGVELPLLKIGSSAGAWDVSWMAYVKLMGQGDNPDLQAASKAAYGGGSPMEVTDVSMDQCLHLIKYEEGGQKKIPFLAKSPNFQVACQADSPDSWVAKNSALLDFNDDCCLTGKMQTCTGTSFVTCADGTQAGYAQGPTGMTVINTGVDGKQYECKG
ncbi:hypothetical protein CAC42_3239 [Sphaceloma murrayae]|uniref:Uncharacterized protein n=1 Tax=Sphaceloma murrayae TaxID=2082308 RepID=A0A2K1QFD1_9PEZI|nr:hypothetical protein CAC42_3239 [Sphaceloma murrayae]